MNRLTVSLLALAILTCEAIGQSSDPDRTPMKPPQIGAPHGYFVSVSEYRITTPRLGSLRTAEVLQMLKQGPQGETVTHLQSVGLSVADGVEATAQFTRRVPVVTGIISNGSHPAQKVMETMEVGTILHVLATAQNDRVRIQLKYESSRVVGDIPDDRTPTFGTSEVDSLLHIPLGELAMVSSIVSNGETIATTITLTQSPDK
ncbi:type II and III secretion system protein [Novipirellula artificiosorum]|uniref:Bacterial type II and III secretion system protein n=1 Tax=Novipirellula artificiosorum TaxID=2528016 RepID=A0A5C6DAZ3_9BACT|nr:type II and III secretion system protein [Novipirellula artificiosorum]TWU34333.1 hypothetical protein Poly41_44800 [Novipirellula artificiosorum]